jgi:hypothetical protein
LTAAAPELPPHELAQSRARNKKEKTVMSKSKPTHRAHIVVEPKDGSDRKATWVEVGAVWPHKNGNGFDVVIPPGISVSGRIVCTEPKEKAATE